MNRKKFIILNITLVMLLSITSVAYALTCGGTSWFSTGVLTVTVSSKTTCDVSADYIGAATILWRDGEWVNDAVSEGSGRQITSSCGASNKAGSQLWEISGLHEVKHNGETDTDGSYASTNY
ncbi:hypothetical protein Dtox_0390 [Desulfofarcimen acetoxidans DSM 771]|uniref:Uncharacterized protein n=1 Tax=Desulfofarcimen acetoxidans (strain ATCC 49208 / DSM 771 / KCTC 5769 / VKM B-1644 / 5575) TaxID=485916 RepID=C8W4Y3_DESAS|nr:hypothetical protein [Desulfofarcimen acetoxidans]ACV61335.1 hypothetical protein Dtox_0390 [Desulfofarcimen acetoxidans DSM 771]